MHSRFLRLILALALVLGMVSGCTPQPQPSPSPTSFATEEEAFAAAEETYRAYVDALNAVDLSDPETFEGVYAWTTGEANAGERKSLTGMHADQWTVSGRTVVQRIQLGEYNRSEGAVSIDVCADVSAIEVLNDAGDSVVSPDRPPLQASTATLQVAQTTTGLAIARIDGGSGAC